MKNAVLFFLFIFLASINLNAQITIESSDFTLEAGSLNKYLEYYSLPLAQMPEISYGENVSWDFSAIEYDMNDTNKVEYFLIHPSSPYQYASFWKNALVDLYGKDLLVEQYETKDADSYRLTGQRIDTLYIPISYGSAIELYEQNSDFEPEYVKMKFPIVNVYDEGFNSYSRKVIHTLVNYPLLGLTNASVDLYTYYSLNVICKGWGTVKLPGYLEPIEAVLLEETEIKIDSIYLNGAPVSSELLSLAGFSQGDSVVTISKRFYSRGFSSYICSFDWVTEKSVNYILGSFVPSDIETRVDDTMPEYLSVCAYPNPSDNRNISISFDKTDDMQWKAIIYNDLGSIVCSHDVNNPAGSVTLSLSMDSPSSAGVYYIKIADNTGKITAQSRFVLAR